MSKIHPIPGDPYIHPFGSVYHFYGDVVRQLFIAAAILIGISVPFSGDIPFAIFVGVPSIIILVVLAGLSNPHGKLILILTAVAAGAAVLIAETLAVYAYASDRLILFAILEAIVLLCLAAMYFSIKDVRAMMMNRIGHFDTAGEFDDSDTAQ